MAYIVPAGEARFSQEIKRSRFIGVAMRVATPDDAADKRASLESEFPDATHHCWAYVLGNPQTSSLMRMDDDGEPAGTAGKPILNVLRHKDVGDVQIVVVRYFGGVKLGAGGLVRAYSSTASGVMDALELIDETPLRRGLLLLDYRDEQPIRRLLEELDVTVNESSYGESVELTVSFPEERAPIIAQALAERSSGRVKLVAV